MAKFLPVLFGAVAATMLAGCSATTIDYRTMTAPQLAASPQYMPIMPRVPDGKVVVGQVEATACQASLTDPVPDHDDAILLLKQAAAVKGATALGGVGSRLIPTRTATCYSSAYAYGVGYIN